MNRFSNPTMPDCQPFASFAPKNPAEIGGFKGPDPEVLDFCNATEDDQAVRVEAESDFHGPLMIAEISNATIGYFRFGDQTTGRPPLLVFAPFGYTMGDMPRPAMRSLAAHQEVILFDHRGQGFSTASIIPEGKGVQCTAVCRAAV